MNSRVTITIALLSGVALCSCDLGNTPGALAVAPPDTLTLAPVARIAPSFPWFHVVRQAALFGDTVVLADAGERKVVIAGLNGEVYAELGREGDGPGEFRGIGAISTVDSRSAYVNDPLLERGTIIRLSPPLLAGTAFTPRNPSDPPASVLGRMADGTLVMRQAILLASDGIEGVRRDTLRLYRTHANGRTLMLTVPGSDWYNGLTGGRTRSGEPSKGRMPLLFAREAYVLVLPYFVVVATSTDGCVRWYTPDGKLQHEWFVPVLHRRVTEAERDQLAKRLSNRVRAEFRASVLRAFLSQPKHHRTIPAFGAPDFRDVAIVRADTTSAVWLRLYSLGADAEWARVDPGRGVTTLLRLAGNPQILAAAPNEFVLLELDQYDRESVSSWKVRSN